jgi:hypothetical protein
MTVEAVLATTNWLEKHIVGSDIKIAYFGASTGAAAALGAAAKKQDVWLEQLFRLETGQI